MTRRDWWLGITLVVAALLVHTLIPRYDWRTSTERPNATMRIDRWSGRMELGTYVNGRWVSRSEAHELDAARLHEAVEARYREWQARNQINEALTATGGRIVSSERADIHLTPETTGRFKLSDIDPQMTSASPDWFTQNAPSRQEKPLGIIKIEPLPPDK